MCRFFVGVINCSLLSGLGKGSGFVKLKYDKYITPIANSRFLFKNSSFTFDLLSGNIIILESRKSIIRNRLQGVLDTSNSILIGLSDFRSAILNHLNFISQEKILIRNYFCSKLPLLSKVFDQT